MRPEQPSFQQEPPGLSELNGPGIALIIAGALGVLAGLTQAASGLFQLLNKTANPALSDPNLPPMLKPYLALLGSGITSLFLSLLILAVNAVIIFGGLKMRHGQSYALCVTAAALCCMPCCFHSCCSVVVIPIGVWALVTLLGGQGKARFSS